MLSLCRRLLMAHFDHICIYVCVGNICFAYQSNIHQKLNLQTVLHCCCCKDVKNICDLCNATIVCVVVAVVYYQSINKNAKFDSLFDVWPDDLTTKIVNIVERLVPLKFISILLKLWININLQRYESNIFRMVWVWCQHSAHTYCNLYL